MHLKGLGSFIRTIPLTKESHFFCHKSPFVLTQMQPYEKSPKALCWMQFSIQKLKLLRNWSKQGFWLSLAIVNQIGRYMLNVQSFCLQFVALCKNGNCPARADPHNDNHNVINSKQSSTRLIKMMNIARGKTGQGYWVFAEVIFLTEIYKFGHLVTPLVLLPPVILPRIGFI